MLPYITSKILDSATTVTFNKLKMVIEKPNVSFDIIKGSYEVISYEDNENVILKLTLLFKNIGKSLTSVTDIITYIKYNEEILNNNLNSRNCENKNYFIKSK